MEVKQIVENEDGSADVVFNLTPDEVSILLSDAIIRAIRNYLDAAVDSNQVR